MECSDVNAYEQKQNKKQLILTTSRFSLRWMILSRLLYLRSKKTKFPPYSLPPRPNTNVLHSKFLPRQKKYAPFSLRGSRRCRQSDFLSLSQKVDVQRKTLNLSTIEYNILNSPSYQLFTLIKIENAKNKQFLFSPDLNQN